MKKKLIFCICMVLCVVTLFGTVPFSAYTYNCDVEVTSKAVLVANLETDTFVYEKNSSTARFFSYLSNIMTYIVVRNNVSDINTRIPIKQEVLDSIDTPDNTLDIYADKTLTIKDLLYYIMLTNGNDACHVLADYVTKGNPEEFVTLMNQKAKEIGCKKTKFSSPGLVQDPSQFTTCRDMYKIIKFALNTPDYKEIAGTASYIPDGYKSKKLAIGNTNSLMRESSPYYFRYITTGKYGEDSVARGNVAAVSYYRDVTYVCIVLGADVTNEHNAFTETKQLLSWAYTTLGNKQIISESEVLATVSAKTTWGESDVDLIAGQEIVRTVPEDYDHEKLTCKYTGDDTVSLPVFEGQNMGVAKVYYDGKLFDKINLVSSSSEGVSMMDDMGDFVSAMFKSTLSGQPVQTDSQLEGAQGSDSSQSSLPDTETETSTQAVQ